MHEKRTGGGGIAGGPALGLSVPEYKNGQSQQEQSGVWGRLGQSSCEHAGGGYLDVCHSSELFYGAKKNARDPRLNELRAMGMHHCWQKVAAEIGVDAFLAMWRILDSESQWQHHKGGLEITLRRYRSYEHFQRDSYIKQLTQKGYSVEEVRKKLILCMGVSLGLKRIREVSNNFD